METSPTTHTSTIWQAPQGKALLIAGPCSAESQEQVLQTALAVQHAGGHMLRAGVWKPRSRPGSFEGRGQAALPWLVAARKLTGLPLAVEVAQPAHVEACLQAGIDVLWLGARTTVNPFLVQELAEALRGVDKPVLIKNPINPDLPLWMGAIERLEAVDVGPVAACHRGFSFYGQSRYRNRPLWDLPLELRRLRPELPLINDPSHIAGDRALVPEVAQMALDLGFDGLMIETHPTPIAAKSDAAQQLGPEAFAELAARLHKPKAQGQDERFAQELSALRAQIDELDHHLLEILAQRLGIVRSIGELKREQDVQFVQMDRYRQILHDRLAQGELLGLSPEFVEQLLRQLHVEALRQHRPNQTD